MKTFDLDIVIPAYFEGENILEVLYSLQNFVRCTFRVIICYDLDEDDTISTIRSHPPFEFEILFIASPIRPEIGKTSIFFAFLILS